jgi:hypothetical protein
MALRKLGLGVAPWGGLLGGAAVNRCDHRLQALTALATAVIAGPNEGNSHQLIQLFGKKAVSEVNH